MGATSAPAIIANLGLQPHPEGGWYRETWRSEAPPGERAGATAILFLLDLRERSHWHRIGPAELWLWHAGSPLTLAMAASGEGPVSYTRLGPDVLARELPQVLVPPGHWQAAVADAGWSLVSCVVSPGFEFSDFELAPPGWSPGRD